jgi:M3 family oligoendopeptidase
MGHAFAGYMAMRTQPLQSLWSEPTDIAEIHSMAMEQFAYPYAELFFGGKAEQYKFQHLQEALTFVPFGVAVDEFQHIVYENPDMTPAERTKAWKALEEKYMPWRDYDDISDFFAGGGWWYHKIHIFHYPFYYINYTLTTMGAMEFKKKMAEDKKKCWADYLTLCKLGGSLGYLDTLRKADLAVPFEKGGVKRATAYAKEILTKEMEKQYEDYFCHHKHNYDDSVAFRFIRHGCKGYRSGLPRNRCRNARTRLYRLASRKCSCKCNGLNNIRAVRNNSAA